MQRQGLGRKHAHQIRMLAAPGDIGHVARQCDEWYACCRCCYTNTLPAHWDWALRKHLKIGMRACSSWAVRQVQHHQSARGTRVRANCSRVPLSGRQVHSSGTSWTTAVQ